MNDEVYKKIYNRLRFVQQLFDLLETQMKIKFLSKKERQEIKLAKQSAQSTNLTNNTMNSQRIQNVSKISVQSPHIQVERMSSQSKSQSNSEQYQRSRQKRIINRQLTNQQKDERKSIKKKYLGLQKPEQLNRLKKNYKSQLLFEWAKSDDTSSGVLNKLSIDSLKSIEKKYYNKKDNQIQKTWKQKSIEEMTDRDWRIFREDNQIFIKGGRVANPFRQWSQYPQLSHDLLKNLKKLKFQKPKPIQMQSIPIGFQNKDMVAIAPTGQGKTLGFLIPVLHHVENLPRINGSNSESGPYVIILGPSRELAEQIQDEFNRIKYGDVTAVRIVGGVQLDFQALDIQKGCDIIIGTPGRVKQLVEKHYLSLSRCSWLVIDQADKMISQNLIEDIQWLLDSMGGQSYFTREEHGKERVTHMFSATMVPEIEKLTKKYLSAPVFITIGEVGGGKKDIEQHVYMISQTQKNDELGKILRGLPAPIIIFVNSRVKCDKLVKIIQQRFNRSCADYHGGKSQDKRQSIIQNFRNGKFQILVATDLGGRGLDIKGISAAISYDAPKNISQFIHRAGRSGRAGVKGKAFTFLTNQDEQIFYDVKTFLERNQFRVPEQLRDHPAAQIKPGTIAFISRRKQVVFTN